METGEHIFSPYFTQPQTNKEHEDDVYKPTMDEEESSGESEDDHFGVDPTMAIVGLTTSRPSNTAPSVSRSQQKRKRGEGSSRSEKLKVPAVKQIADDVSVIDNVSLYRAAALTGNKESSIPEVMKYLLSLEDVKHEKAFEVRCMQALETKACQEMFVSLKEDLEYLITWLHFIVGEQ